MPITPLGRDSLKAHLLGNGRVTIANRASTASSFRILAAAIVRHSLTGASSRAAVWDLDLAPGEAESIEPYDASDDLFAGIEVVFRVFSPDEHGLREIYLASPPDAAPARQWEVGVRLETEPPAEHEFFVPDTPGLVAYLSATM